MKATLQILITGPVCQEKYNIHDEIVTHLNATQRDVNFYSSPDSIEVTIDIPENPAQSKLPL